MFVGNFNRYIKEHILDRLSCSLRYPFILHYEHIFINFLLIFYSFLLKKKNRNRNRNRNNKKFNKNTKKYCKKILKLMEFFNVQMFDLSLV
jgi:hypothetical protein